MAKNISLTGATPAKGETAPVVAAFNAAQDAADLKAAVAAIKATEKTKGALARAFDASAKAAFGENVKVAFAPLAVAIMDGVPTKWCDANEAAPAAKFFRHWDATFKRAAFDAGLKGDDRRRAVNPLARDLKTFCHKAGGSPAKAEGAGAAKPKGSAVPQEAAEPAQERREESEGAAAVRRATEHAALALALRLLEKLAKPAAKTAGDKRDVENCLAQLREIERRAA